MILCITPNVAADRTLVVPDLKLATVHKASQQTVAAGGKGVNVARAIRVFGKQPLCMGFLGGHTGRLVDELARSEALSCEWTWIDGETRTCVLVVDPMSGQVTEIDEQGPNVTNHDWENLHATILKQAAHTRAICLSGSLPPGSSLDKFSALLHDLKASHDLWIDMSGAPLQTALNIGAVNIKINNLEAEILVKQRINDPDQAFVAAQEIKRMGARQVVITLGKQGAVFVSDSECWFARSPSVHSISAVGSGDVFLGALVSAFIDGANTAKALCCAVAAGAANTLVIGGGNFDLADFNRLLAGTQTVALSA